MHIRFVDFFQVRGYFVNIDLLGLKTEVVNEVVDVIGERIRQARIAAGMTQDEVVAALQAVGVSLTKGGLSKYERGGSVPKPTTLRGLARTLGVETSFFVEERSARIEWAAFRRAARLGKKRRERIMTLAEAQVEVFLTLERALEPHRQRAIPSRTPVSSPEGAEIAAQALRDHWKFGDQPIKSVTTAIEDAGGIVVEADGEEEMFDGLSGWANEGVPVIVVSAAVSDDRRRFNLAHELGHLFMHLRAVEKSRQERLAHRFAAAFLVPKSIALRELGAKRRHLTFGELAMLKKKHGLSMQAWVCRANDLGIIQESQMRRLFAEMSRRGWRRREPVMFQGMEEPTRLQQYAVRALAEGLISRAQAERFWPGVTREADEPSERKRGPLDARSLMQLTKQERERLLEQAAALVGEEYKEGGGLSSFESLSEEDHSDEPVEQ